MPRGDRGKAGQQYEGCQENKESEDFQQDLVENSQENEVLEAMDEQELQNTIRVEATGWKTLSKQTSGAKGSGVQTGQPEAKS